MHGMTKDQILIRLKDFILILVALAGAYAGLSRAYINASEIPDLKTTIARHETQLAVINAQYSEIIRRLDRIEKQ